MSERLSGEHGSSSHEEHKEHHEQHEHEAKVEHAEHKHVRHEHKEKIEQIRHRAERESVSAEDIRLGEEEDKYKPSEAFVNKELKTMAYARLLNRARKGLKPSERLISKFMHQPVVDKLSEATARSVGRPSGILGGGILAFLGTTIYYYITKHYGYDYNYFIFLLLLIGGFITGWIVELLIFVLRTPGR